jgi:hypothetical protein
MKFAYADPPYLGQAKKHYGPDAREVNHAQLINYLCEHYPDGWALSCSSPSLRTILPLCPEDVRIAAWVKPFCAFKKGVRPAYAWEPVIFRGGRNKNHPAPPKGGVATTPKDFVSCNITLKKGLVGAKPDAFCFWLFDLLNMQPDDEFDDVFPGSGAVSRAWEAWRRQTRIA